MARIDTLLTELEREARTTRKHLARLPDDKFAWRPHAKSFSGGDLACHLVDCIGWTESIFNADEYAMDTAAYQPFSADSQLALLEGFDRAVVRARQAMSAAGDREAAQPWRLRINGKVWFEKPRETVFRDMALNHLIHHRGQLSVYLRLLEIPVPGTYGPTADEP
jgi:uncharacterized damage-inducible protein DinB